MIGISVLFIPWGSYGTKHPGSHEKSHEACDWEKPLWIHQGKVVLNKPDNLYDKVQVFSADGGPAVDIVNTDFSRAFDVVSPGLLLCNGLDNWSVQ